MVSFFQRYDKLQMPFNNLVCLFVKLIHIAFIAFIALVPFISRTVAPLFLHFITVPFLYLHWATNNDTCALTLIECYMRGCSQDRSFVYSIVGPIYKVDPAYINTVTKVAPLVLWLVSCIRICSMYTAWKTKTGMKLRSYRDFCIFLNFST